MKKINITLLTLFFLFGFFKCVIGQSKKHSDDKLYDDLRTVQGKIVILNHPELGKTEGRNLRILFQRIGCKKCVVSVKSDSEGNYSLTLSKGKYRVIYRQPKVVNEKYYDSLSKKQKRIVDVSTAKSVVNFDIEIFLP